MASSGTRSPIEGQPRLIRAWIEAGQKRIGICQMIPGDNMPGDDPARCAMDYPEDRYVVTQ